MCTGVTSLVGCGGLVPQRYKAGGMPSSRCTFTKTAAVLADCIARRWPTSLTVAGAGQPAAESSALPVGGVQLLLKVGAYEDPMVRIGVAGSSCKTGVWTLGTCFGSTPQQVIAARECR